MSTGQGLPSRLRSKMDWFTVCSCGDQSCDQSSNLPNLSTSVQMPRLRWMSVFLCPARANNGSVEVVVLVQWFFSTGKKYWKKISAYPWSLTAQIHLYSVYACVFTCLSMRLGFFMPVCVCVPSHTSPNQCHFLSLINVCWWGFGWMRLLRIPRVVFVISHDFPPSPPPPPICAAWLEERNLLSASALPAQSADRLEKTEGCNAVNTAATRLLRQFHTWVTCKCYKIQMWLKL